MCNQVGLSAANQTGLQLKRIDCGLPANPPPNPTTPGRESAVARLRQKRLETVYGAEREPKVTC